MTKRVLTSDFVLKIIKVLAETMKVDGHAPGIAGPTLFIFGQIGANIVIFDATWYRKLSGSHLIQGSKFSNNGTHMCPILAAKMQHFNMSEMGSISIWVSFPASDYFALPTRKCLLFLMFNFGSKGHAGKTEQTKCSSDFDYNPRLSRWSLS